jgi:hypothetical protein
MSGLYDEDGIDGPWERRMSTIPANYDAWRTAGPPETFICERCEVEKPDEHFDETEDCCFDCADVRRGERLEEEQA